MAPHSSTLAWKIPRMEEPGRPQSMGPRTLPCLTVLMPGRLRIPRTRLPEAAARGPPWWGARASGPGGTARTGTLPPPGTTLPEVNNPGSRSRNAVFGDFRRLMKSAGTLTMDPGEFPQRDEATTCECLHQHRWGEDYYPF